MSRISVFNHVSIDGFFAGPNGELDWFYSLSCDADWYKYTHSQAAGSSTLIFGHTTYEMMKSYWPTPNAIKNDPVMAKSVNESPKIVFSKKLKKVEEGPIWKNITLYHKINPDEIIKLKKKIDMMILGSGSIVQQFSNLNLIDDYFLVVVPVILGKGKSFFENVKKKDIKLVNAKPFKNCIVLLHYSLLKNM
jgi:dihydrofolate reductase